MNYNITYYTERIGQDKTAVEELKKALEQTGDRVAVVAGTGCITSAKSELVITLI